jgi:hypothetical protein
VIIQEDVLVGGQAGAREEINKSYFYVLFIKESFVRIVGKQVRYGL